MEKDELLRQARDHYNDDQVALLEKAIDFATQKHDGQQRKSGEPYITHPLQVASTLIDWGMDIDSIAAGVLHDTVEDTDATLEEISEQFGADISFLVDGVTKVGQARAGMKNLDSYLPSTKDNLTKLLIAVGQDVRVIIIKLADRLHNMQTLQFKSEEKQKKIARETLDVFAPLADRLNMGRLRVQLEELSFKYLMPEEYNQTVALKDSRLKKSQRKLDATRRAVDSHLTKEKIPHKNDGRVKSTNSLKKKLQRLPNIDDIYDLIALRIIVDDIDTCYLVLNELHSMYEPMVGRIKDYISKPKPNGYQSLHTTVTTKNGQVVEFQIRTHDMHDYAERGLAASFHYNEQKLTDAYKDGKMTSLPTDLHWIKQLQSAASMIREGKDFDVDNLKVDLFGNRIFVYSPKGDIYDLPDGSFPLDYAYRVHSDLAAKASGFLVNGKMEPFSYRLKHGDTIEILTSKRSRPKPGWIDLTITSHARMKLKSQLKKHSLLDQVGNLWHRTARVATLRRKKQK